MTFRAVRLGDRGRREEGREDGTRGWGGGWKGGSEGGWGKEDGMEDERKIREEEEIGVSLTHVLVVRQWCMCKTPTYTGCSYWHIHCNYGIVLTRSIWLLPHRVPERRMTGQMYATPGASEIHQVRVSKVTYALHNTTLVCRHTT